MDKFAYGIQKQQPKHRSEDTGAPLFRSYGAESRVFKKRLTNVLNIRLYSIRQDTDTKDFTNGSTAIERLPSEEAEQHRSSWRCGAVPTR